MKLTKFLVIAVLLTPILSLASNKKCDGNSYEINQCLKTKMKTLDNKLDKVKKHDITSFKKSRDLTCSDISSTYEGGTYQAVKYGNCVISLDRWYLEQIQD